MLADEDGHLRMMPAAWLQHTRANLRMDACSATNSIASDKCSPKTVAVVIPVYARTAKDIGLLLDALQALVAQHRRPDFVVIVDDAGPLPVLQQEDQPAFIVRRRCLLQWLLCRPTSALKQPSLCQFGVSKWAATACLAPAHQHQPGA